MINFTQRLLMAERQGMSIVCGLAPYEGWPVVHRPRSKKDPQPWRLQHQDGSEWPEGFRYFGRECRAVEAETRAA